MYKKLEWIKIDESDNLTLPVWGMEVLIYSEEGRVSVEKRHKVEDFIYSHSTDSGVATHWAFLPEPPKS